MCTFILYSVVRCFYEWLLIPHYSFFFRSEWDYMTTGKSGLSTRAYFQISLRMNTAAIFPCPKHKRRGKICCFFHPFPQFPKLRYLSKVGTGTSCTRWTKVKLRKQTMVEFLPKKSISENAQGKVWNDYLMYWTWHKIISVRLSTFPFPICEIYSYQDW